MKYSLFSYIKNNQKLFLKQT